LAAEFITLARVVKTQGRHGEVAVEVHSDVPDRFREEMPLLALSDEGQRRELKIEALWPHKNYLILKFAGIDSISDAELLVGAELQVPGQDRAQLESGWNYVSDLVGCRLLDGGHEIGIVKDVRFGAGEAPLLVVVAGRVEYEIPFAEAFLKSLDLHGKRIVMELPEGMLEINAPLTAEEKQRQRGGE
jgi:16S rRNA processing protein RimM